MKKEMCRALTDSGLDVVFVGICPTPGLYFALRTLPVDGGLMITASHNPKEYNGMKICLGTESVWGEEIQEIKRLYKAGQHIATHAIGQMNEYPIVDEYVNMLADHFKHLVGMQLSAVIDCGNGAAGTVLPQLVERMQWKNVQLLYCDVDGTYPHHEADPTVEKNMLDVKKFLATTNAAVGLGLDGDCDRLGAMTKAGELVSGDKLLAVFAQPLLKENAGATIVFDIKASEGLIELLYAWGAQPHMSPSGHTNIKERMKKYNALLAGELSGHYFFKDRYYGFDDGIYALLRLFEILQTSGKSLQELLAVFPKKYSSLEYRLACPEEKKAAVIAAIQKAFTARDDITMVTVDGIRATMPYGWGLVRPSNTQAVLSMRFESDSREGLQKVKQDFIAILSHHLDAEVLQELQK